MTEPVEHTISVKSYYQEEEKEEEALESTAASEGSPAGKSLSMEEALAAYQDIALKELSPTQKQEITTALTALAKQEAAPGLTGIYNDLNKWLGDNPYPPPTPPNPYAPWKTYATDLQNQLSTIRSQQQNNASTNLTNGINAFIQAHPDLGSGGDIWNFINKEMSPSPYTTLGVPFDQYQTAIQDQLLNPIYSGKEGVLPKPASPPPPPDMQPATEKTLKIAGVSTVLMNDPVHASDPTQSIAIPVSHTSDSGGNGMPDSTSTESIWYFLELAYDAGDQVYFQQLMNGYYYLVEQKAQTVSGTSWAVTPGLAGWIITLGIPPGSNLKNGGLPYPQNDPRNSRLSTATDADEQIIAMMIKGIAKFGDLNLHCFGTFPSGSAPADKKMSDLLKEAVGTFLVNNIAGYPQSSYDKAHHGFKYEDTLYNPVLSNDNWGGGGWTDDPNNPMQGTFLNPSYVDAETLAIIYQYAKSQDFSSEHVANFHQAMVNSVAYLEALQANFVDPTDPNVAGMPDNPAWNEDDGPDGKSPHPVGWDSIRFLTKVAKYVDYIENKGNTDPFGIVDKMKSMGTKMLNYVIKYSQSPYTSKMVLAPGKADLFGGALLGPLLLAMKVLTPNDPNIGAVEKSLAEVSEVDMAQIDPSRSDAYTYWQSQYYGAMLALVNAFDSQHLGS